MTIKNTRTPLLITFFCGMTLSANLFAAPPPVAPSWQDLSKGINAVAAAIYAAERHYIYDMTRSDPALATLADMLTGTVPSTTANTPPITIAENTAATTQKLSLTDTTNLLQPLGDATKTIRSGSSIKDTYTKDLISQRYTNQLNQTEVKDLTWGVLASDSPLATFQPTTSKPASGKYNGITYNSDPLYYNFGSNLLANPLTYLPLLAQHDSYFTFSSFFDPLNYGSDLAAPQYYLQYLTQGYNDISTQNLKNLSKLNGKIQSVIGANKDGATASDTAATILRTLITSPVFQKYQLTVRSITAEQSLATTNLNHLYAERSPIITDKNDPSLDAVALAITGIAVTPIKGKYQYPSALQIHSYAANHDLSDPKWYAHVQGESSANVQRESLIALRQIQAGLFQQHLDNERMIALESNLNLQNSRTESKTALLQSSMAIDSWIKTASAADQSSSVPDLTDDTSSSSGGS